MKTIRKWAFLWIITIFGVAFLTVSDSWEVMAEPYIQAMGRLGLYQEPGEDGTGNRPLEEAGQTYPKKEGPRETYWGKFKGAIYRRLADSRDDEIYRDQDGNGQLADGQGEGEIYGAEGNEADSGQPDLGISSGAKEGEDLDDGVIQEITYRNPEDVEYIRVEDDYFADALFIGDSRTVGMMEYGGLEEIATFYASTGMTIYRVLSEKVTYEPADEVQSEEGGAPAGGGAFRKNEKVSVEEALGKIKFSKIYLMVGINEMGVGTVDTFIAKYEEVLQRIRELQPGAIIYLQGIMKVTTKRSNQGDYINNQGIEKRNARIEQLADYVSVYYLDVNPLFCNESGGMIPDYTTDGVHLKAKYIPIWKEFLGEHGVKPYGGSNNM